MPDLMLITIWEKLCVSVTTNRIIVIKKQCSATLEYDLIISGKNILFIQ